MGSAAADGPVGGADEPREDRDRGIDGVFVRSRSCGIGVGMSMMMGSVEEGADDAPRLLRDRGLSALMGTAGGCGGAGGNGDGGISASLGEGSVDDAPRLLLDRGVGGKLCERRTPCMGTVGGGGAGGVDDRVTELVRETVGESTRIGSWKLGS